MFRISLGRRQVLTSFVPLFLWAGSNSYQFCTLAAQIEPSELAWVFDILYATIRPLEYKLRICPALVYFKLIRFLNC